MRAVTDQAVSHATAQKHLRNWSSTFPQLFTAANFTKQKTILISTEATCSSTVGSQPTHPNRQGLRQLETVQKIAPKKVLGSSKNYKTRLIYPNILPFSLQGNAGCANAIRSGPFQVRRFHWWENPMKNGKLHSSTMPQSDPPSWNTSEQNQWKNFLPKRIHPKHHQKDS